MVEHRNLMQSTLDNHNKELADRTQQVSVPALQIYLLLTKVSLLGLNRVMGFF